MSPIAFIEFELIAHAGCETRANVQTCRKHAAGIAFAKNHISRFTRRSIAIFRGHHQIGKAVTVGVSCTVDRNTQVITRLTRHNFEARTGDNAAGTQVGDDAIGIAIHHKSSPPCGRQAIHACAHNEVVVTVTVEVADGGQVFNGHDAVDGHHNGTARIGCGEVQCGVVCDACVGVARCILDRCGRNPDVVTSAGQQVVGRVDRQVGRAPAGDQATAGHIKALHQRSIGVVEFNQACAL